MAMTTMKTKKTAMMRMATKTKTARMTKMMTIMVTMKREMTTMPRRTTMIRMIRTMTTSEAIIRPSS